MEAVLVKVSSRRSFFKYYHDWEEYVNMNCSKKRPKYDTRQQTSLSLRGRILSPTHKSYPFRSTSLLRADPIEWLLEEENPSVRFFALTDILDRPRSDSEVIRAKQKIMKSGVVPKILSEQTEDGYWEGAEDFYLRTKYRGTVWQMIILAELGADGNDQRIQKTCEFVITMSQDRASGGFAYRGTEKGGGFPSAVIPCLTGNMIWSLIRFGYLDDPRVRKGIDWIAHYTRYDDGVDCKPKGWPFEKREPCWGKHTCFLTIVKALKAFVEVPAARRSQKIQRVIDQGAEFLLKHHLFRRSHNLDSLAKPKWIKLGFPSMWDTDILEMLNILTKLGFWERRMEEALDLVLSKQDGHGRWILENTYNGRFRVNIEQKDKPSKWVTLNALRAIKQAKNLTKR